MTLSDRYRASRDDPYRGYDGARRSGNPTYAIGLPLVIALALVASVTFAAIRPSATAKADRAAAGGSYQSLLVPAAAATGRRSTARVVMAANASVPALEGHAASSVTTDSVSHRGHGSYRTDQNGYRVAPAEDSSFVPATTYLAHLEHTTKGYPSASAFQSNRKVPGSWYGYPSILPIVDATRDRYKVMLAQRPDEATSWISTGSAVLTRIHYAIVVDLSQHWLYVFYKGIQIMSFPVGNGKSYTPTPTGNYFVAFHAPPNGPGYGSVMLETSAHSRVIAHFEGGNDAIIAIHGPVGSDSQIGDHGAAISNGCIRMHDYDLKQVRHVRNGTPVYLVD